MAQVGKKYTKWILFAILIVVAAFIIFPILIVLMNSFKGNLFISSAGAFKFPNEQSFVGISNYTNGIDKINFFTLRLHLSFSSCYLPACLPGTSPG